MREKIRLKYFAVFIFLAILFFINTNTVFAKVGSSSFGTTGKDTKYKPAEELQSKTDNTCKIYISSNKKHPEQKQFSLGWKADIFANTDDFYSNNASAGKVAWTSFDNLIAYPYIVLFEERWQQSNGAFTYKSSTGYLYLYADSYSTKARAAIWATYANTNEDTYMPLYYQNSKAGSEGNGEAFFGIDAAMLYLPISNIKCVSTDANKNGAYYAQNFTSHSQADAEKVLDKIMTECEGKQDLSGWEVWYDDTKFLMGNLLISSQVKPISSKYKWVSMFAIGAMGENTWDNVGISFAQTYGKEYKVKREHIIAGFQGLADELKVDVNSQIFKDMITGNPECISSYGYLGFKDNYQLYGTDSYFSFLEPKTIGGVTPLNGYSGVYWENDGTQKIIDGQQILEKAYDILFSGGSYNILDKERIRLTPDMYVDVYNQILDGIDELGDVNFLSISDVGNFIPRHVWGATVGSLGACKSWCSKDVDPDNKNKDSDASIIGRKLPGNSYAAKKENHLTRNFGSFATDDWDKLTEDEKITNTIIMIETYPWYVPLVAPKTSIGNKLGSGAGTIKNLNSLGANKSTYQYWRKYICEIGDYIVKHSLTDVFPANGWPAQSAFSDGSFYASPAYPIFIALTPKTTTYEDLLISNSYSSSGNILYFNKILDFLRYSKISNRFYNLYFCNFLIFIDIAR